jgi:hypothetical protein
MIGYINSGWVMQYRGTIAKRREIEGQARTGNVIP